MTIVIKYQLLSLDMKKLSEIDERIAQLRAMRQQVASREAMNARRNRSRQCATLGEWLLSNEPSKVQEIVQRLEHEQDRKMFSI